MRLQQLQRLFQQRVLEGRAGIEAQLTSPEQDDLPLRLSTYTEGYRSRIVEALGVTYPALNAVLGNEAFEASARDFIEANPSRQYSIRYYGERLCEFIGSGRDDAEAAVLGDLARWEWTLAEVFDASDDQPVDNGLFAGLSPEDWPRMVLSLRSSVRPLGTASNAVQWWRWARDDGPRPPAFEQSAAAGWLQWREDLRTLFRSMDAAEAAALAVVRGGGSFGRMCEAVAAEVGEEAAPARAAAILATWLKDKVIADVTIGSDGPK